MSVDIDGVLLDTMITYVALFNEKYRTSYTKNDVTGWEFFHNWKVSEKEAWDIFLQIYKDSMDAPFIDEKIPEILKDLNTKHDVYIVSARMNEYREPVLEKLRHHEIYPEIHYLELILLYHKPYDLKLKQDFDVFVDDNPNLVEPIKNMKNRVLLLFDQPWNQDVKLNKNVIRVRNWTEIQEYFSS